MDIKKQETSINNKTAHLGISFVIGSVYGQTVTGNTLFKYKILEERGKYRKYRYFLVENVETKIKHVICENELHCL
jgi:hypothetical protein